MSEEVILEVTTIEENVTIETEADETVVIKVVAPAGPTGATGAAGPNSVTSATTSDGTGQIMLDTLAVGICNILDEVVFDTLTYTFAEGSAQALKDALGISFADVSDAETGTANLTLNNVSTVSFTAGNSSTTSGEITIFTNGPVFQWRSDTVEYGEKGFTFLTTDITSEVNYTLPNATGTLALTGNTNGEPDKLTAGTISGATTFNATSYTYGTGAAAAHRTALGLDSLFDGKANLSGGNTFTGSQQINGDISSNGVAITNTAMSMRSTSGQQYVARFIGQNSGYAGFGVVATNAASKPFIQFGAGSETAANFSLVMDSGSSLSVRGGNVLGGALLTISSNTSIGINNATPNAAALLDMTSTTKGLLPPRMTTTQRNVISSPPAGLVIYNTTTNNLNSYSGSAWVELVDSADLGTNVANFLEFPTSANLALALTDEEGTGGGFVRAEGATLTSPSIAGTASFTGATRPTSAGTGTPAATSLMTRDDVALEPFYNLGSVFRVSATPAFANSGTGSSSATQVSGDRFVNMSSGTANSGWARAQIGRGLTTVPSLSGAGINFASKLGASIVLWLGNSGTTDNLNIFRLRFGSDNTPVADGVDAVAYRGFGVEIKARGSSHDWRVYGHNGTSITYSAWSNTGLIANILYTRIFLSVISNGSGTITASLGVNGSRTLSTITTTGGPTTSGTSAQSFIDVHVANSASGTLPLAASLYDAMFYAQT